MTDWITSDLHFHHKNILRFCAKTRPWGSVDEMNEALIEEWNSKVKKQDTIYHLGDFSFNPKKTESILEQLNGEKVFILGNHDQSIRKMLSRYGDTYDYLERSVQKTKVCMFHYSIRNWNAQGRGSVHLFGHAHGNLHPPGKCLDVGYDNLGCIIELEDAFNIANSKEVFVEDHHAKIIDGVRI